jgi:hypothetical protein
MLLATFTEARIVTITAKATFPQGVPGTNEINIESFEVAEVISFSIRLNIEGGSRLEIVKGGHRAVVAPITGYSPGIASEPLIVAGPATIRLIATSMDAAGLCTVRITPEAYPPDKSILVPPGTGGAAITLECSTNLVNWTATTNGVYTNLPAAKFFRIREERIQGN